MAIRKYFGTTTAMIAGAVPFVGLMVLAHIEQSRSAADLALADRCVDWAHEPKDRQAADGPDLAARCERYFRVRSADNADEDDRRWAARAPH
jgi:hypothetical protein|uniref:Uncharacterized protein n=1 Tax=uncultured organism TaxID=155900 RepID=A0A7L9QBY8_9ZZZZ|nr:hypothetical protein [uncultured organism]